MLYTKMIFMASCPCSSVICLEFDIGPYRVGIKSWYFCIVLYYKCTTTEISKYPGNLRGHICSKATPTKATTSPGFTRKLTLRRAQRSCFKTRTLRWGHCDKWYESQISRYLSILGSVKLLCHTTAPFFDFYALALSRDWWLVNSSKKSSSTQLVSSSTRLKTWVAKPNTM